MTHRKIRGVEIVRDTAGKPTAVRLDLRMHGQLWDEIYDCLLATLREAEPRESLSEVQTHLESSRCRR